jgi:hypothetical protein
MRLTILAIITATALGACSAPSQTGGYDRDLNTKTAGAAVVSGFAKMCGGKRITEYRDSFVQTMKAQRPVSAEAESKIRAQFTSVDSSVAARFPDAATRKKQCTEFPLNQATIDRGVAGDFTGQI